MQKMDALLKASESFDQADFDEKTFVKFMQQVAIWEYFGLSKNDYVALPELEKRNKIYQYYIDMKQKGDGGECLYFVFVFVLFVLSLSTYFKKFQNQKCFFLFISSS